MENLGITTPREHVVLRWIVDAEFEKPCQFEIDEGEKHEE